ncbi:DUF1653 domain-containing protein [Chromobacterium sphagni]|uniref:DUF1653 domain-containing protein n=1 Tax=Chromobacterium sphagni TaxID=1903179 RepID=A0A1S1WXA0_9NEIS|nr:DUF1653 domain-containing protein [Chromobacterium sphagni]OHX11675.1 hypothetical protein BI347_18710 [Chromobacterium sphagni]OHX15548.1 hypothetical protein BI344_22125 [Chromobacterium sphagni]
MPEQGIYQHFRDRRLYQVLGIAKHSETLEPMVVYRALYGDYSLWTRPASMFDEMVAHEGRQVPRFRLMPAR